MLYYLQQKFIGKFPDKRGKEKKKYWRTINS